MISFSNILDSYSYLGVGRRRVILAQCLYQTIVNDVGEEEEEEVIEFPFFLTS
ncbi:hypothetical protein [Candidatus Nitrosocosmicus arcticus]|uniref:Uncharacterized protein n=1 Tax=Candidatus Nitrosocosmicus arcticus TaxID=2035267 RepID=A0A557SZ42_9ARCH|nr:hypothetical protein [Candidatus Nitrosocosmicus arcticus]TVP41870.1 hypothetical protein NARC_10276 [Candidatus Nitrosocosmicus arcticus]